MKSTWFAFSSAILFAVSSLSAASTQFEFDLEGGYARSGYNDVRSPGNTGTELSLSEDLDADDVPYSRLRISFKWQEKHTISLLAAPLTIESSGILDEDILFEDVLFPEGTTVNSTYQFNSYRFTYRYDFYQSRFDEFGIGITGKVRDADIGLESQTLEAVKDDLGFVPLINFRYHHRFNDKVGFLLSGDALAAPQGRAEDILAAFTFRFSEKIKLKLGYRILEGGADNDEVYTFSLINYAALGVIFTL